MAQVCELCGRGPQKSFKRSHSNIAIKRRQNINLQTVRINGKKIKVCTRCLKKLRKNPLTILSGM